MHFVEYGTGTPVLALHGWTPDHRLMTGCLEPVFARRPGYRRIYPDLPGMGKTPIGAVADAEGYLDAVERFVDAQLGDAPFLLVGESYGGYLARALAHRRPGQVRGLALICPVGTVINGTRNVPPKSVVKAEPELLASLEPAVREDYAETAVVQSPETLLRFREEVLSGAALADLEALERIRPHRELATPPESGTPYPGPSLILCGRQDHVAGFADVYPLLEHYPRASFAVLDRAGHNLQFEAPELFEALVSEWLDRVAEAVSGYTA